MFNSIALNVVIGLVFIYLLYSLFATVLAEIIATYIGLRARNLKEAVDRMLNDEVKNPNIVQQLIDSLRLMKNPKNEAVTNFYDHPEIKYLGSSGIFRNPSSFKSLSFAKTILYLLNDYAQRGAEVKDPEITPERITLALRDASCRVLGEQTKGYVNSLWAESYGDLQKFKLLLEGWFDRTMEQALEWYKRKIQIVLLVLGFSIAAFFNADSLTIVKKLSVDKEAREQLVKLATAYVAEHPAAAATPSTAADSTLDPAQRKLDSLLAVKAELQADMVNAGSLLGSGGWPPAVVSATRVPRSYGTTPDSLVNFSFPLEPGFNLRSDQIRNTAGTGAEVSFDVQAKLRYLWFLICRHFWGFLITAIAISLGAPFWFDLLNKLMKLRTAPKQPTDTAQAKTDGEIAVPARDL